MHDFTYPPVIWTAKAAFRLLGQKITLTGTENVPTEGGVLLAVNHIGYVDFIYGGLAAHPSRRLVRFMAKREVFDHPVGGPVMRSFHHIPVDRGDGVPSMEMAVDYLRAGEAVGIFPEATISRSFELKEFKTGAVRIAAAAGVPVVPVVLWGTQRMMTKGHSRDFSRGMAITVRAGVPLHPTGDDPIAETAELKASMAAMLDEVIAAYPADQQPEGSWWLPARFGGSAPTLEQAKELEVAERRERARRRAEARKGKK
ncbi:1-acyl-sn-glycerol-3-phosphate acyltransferase [Nocardioides sp. GY 10113]|uniref:lysophospholipid acyltransferase family protein n=1 Tax=Nocardioides sp. GY 10113 TaxID=2569761 RepID=UPI0010A8A51F|nr:lysophospholipid acyltransferase family protein [Nocardioides sp. GY 10113]TIC88996.1 1-acyl-sn-glycerol-3-phosphate acyltransferase [Nocardioides sp. GY 10113]